MKKLLTVLLAVSLVMSLAAFASAAVGDEYKAVADFDSSASDGTPWQYMYSEDGASTFTYYDHFDPEHEYGDYWITAEGGPDSRLGFQPGMDTMELNTTDDNGGIPAVVFVAPEDGKYEVSSFNLSKYNEWGQEGENFYIVRGTTQISSTPMGAEAVTVQSVEVNLDAGEKLYFYAKTTGEWLSTHIDEITITLVGDQDEDPVDEDPVDETEPGDVLPIAMVVISAVTAGGALIARKRR